MAWTYRSPLSFPARYPAALRKAVANLSEPVLLHSGTPEDVSSDAENFRHYRWCLRQRPDVDKILGSYLELYQFRTSIEHYPETGLLYLVAKPSKLSVLADLNPHLEDIILSECQ